MKVLCFDGYFHENLSEMQQSGSYRIRRVKIAFYLEDETVQIVEPKMNNSGLSQGNIVKRQRATERTSNPEDKKFITLMDFNVDQPVTIFDRTYHITNCDAATRRFLTDLGITVPESTPVPMDPGQDQRERAEYAIRNKKKCTTKSTKFAQFLQNYRKVLLFHGYWDDRGATFGDLRRLVVHYYLADDTIEIKELFPCNSGRHESSGIFLKRMRLPKHPNAIPDIGQSTAVFPVLNVMGENFNTGRFIPDAVDSLERAENYCYLDLVIGSEINVFGRKVKLTSCDDFTKKFYRDNLGVEEFPDIPTPTDDGKQNIKWNGKAEMPLPPFNGWGTHEDSEGNCKTVEPRPPPIDYDKFVTLDGKMLRFTAKMVTKNIENITRTFILTYCLSNDTVAVFEIPRRNSGFSGGLFLHGKKFFLPDQDMLSAARPKPYTPQHFYIGATINLNSHIFHIVGADDYALDYMEQNCKEFPFSDVGVIVEKCRNQFVDKIHYKNLMAKYWTSAEDGGGAFIPAERVRQLLIELFPNGGISEQEILTICRHFSIEKQQRDNSGQWSRKNRATVRNIILTELQRSLWSDHATLEHYLKYISVHGETDNKPKEFTSPSKILTVIRGARLPLSTDQIELILHVLERNTAGEISVRDFLSFLNYAEEPRTGAPMELPELSVGNKEDLAGKVPSSFIDWTKLVDSIAV